MDASKNNCADMSNDFKDLSIEGGPCTELGRKAVGPRQRQDPFERAMVVRSISPYSKSRADYFKIPGGAAPGTKAKQLLGLPYTIREKILQLVLASNGFVHISYSRLKQTDTRYARGHGHLHKCSLGLKKGGTSIFLVCRQLRNEAARILYGSTSFSSFNATGLREQFVPHQMGRDNASCIRRLTLGVPESLKVVPDTALPHFLDLFCDAMPNLQTLDFTTRFKLFSILHNDLEKGEPCSWIKEQRAMLNTAAWITLRHPKLKKAIWLAKSGEDDEEGEQEVRLYVKLLALDMKYALRTYTPTFAFMDSDEERRVSGINSRCA